GRATGTPVPVAPRHQQVVPRPGEQGRGAGEEQLTERVPDLPDPELVAALRLDEEGHQLAGYALLLLGRVEPGEVGGHGRDGSPLLVRMAQLEGMSVRTFRGWSCRLSVCHVTSLAAPRAEAPPEVEQPVPRWRLRSTTGRERQKRRSISSACCSTRRRPRT